MTSTAWSQSISSGLPFLDEPERNTCKHFLRWPIPHECAGSKIQQSQLATYCENSPLEFVPVYDTVPDY